MTINFAEKARAGRRAALATLNARLARGANGANVVSIYETRMAPRRSVPEFRSVRGHQPALQPVLVLTDRIAA